MVVLDTDHMCLLEWSGSPVARRLEDRLNRLPAVEIATAVISFEEQTRGWMAELARSKSLTAQVEVYRRLQRQLEIYCAINILSFDERTAVEFQRLKKAVPRLGTMDLKIAAIALCNQATLLSRNLRDFQRVRDLKVEDWTK